MANFRSHTDCPMLLATCDALRRTKVVEDLLVRRLVRKSKRVLEMWENAKRDWNQTLYEMAAYAMGAPRNSGAFRRLASKATFRMCSREKGSAHGVEALLLGTSGLLTGDYLDNYVLNLQRDFAYLVNKYDISPMTPCEWDRSASYPAGSPVMRIAQFAAIVSSPDFDFDNVLACRTIEDVSKLFSAEVGDYWQKRHTSKGVSFGVPKRLGREKIVVMTINFVVPLQFAYAEVMHKESAKESAMALLESLPSEHNHIVSRWTGEGVPCASAFDSQALIELETFCKEGRCGECPLAKEIKRA